MINVAIIEDNDEDFASLNKELDNAFEINNIDYRLTRFKNAKSFITSAHKEKYNLAFVDIQLENNENGFEASKILRMLDKDVLIVFVTSLITYAVSGYEVGAVDYILKPITHDLFIDKMDKIINKFVSLKNRTIGLKSCGTTIYINTDSIDYIEVLKHYIIYHEMDKEHRVRGVMDEVEKEVSNYGFSRCNKSFIVNMNKVSSVEDNLVYIKNQKQPIIIGRTYRAKFLNDLAKYLN